MSGQMVEVPAELLEKAVCAMSDLRNHSLSDPFSIERFRKVMALADVEGRLEFWLKQAKEAA